MKGEAKQTSFATGGHRQVEERAWARPLPADDLDVPALLHYEETGVARRCSHQDRAAQTGCDLLQCQRRGGRREVQVEVSADRERTAGKAEAGVGDAGGVGVLEVEGSARRPEQAERVGAVVVPVPGHREIARVAVEV